jgi:CRP/FNR family cyclic AMP-dependent transcriptional regulator
VYEQEHEIRAVLERMRLISGWPEQAIRNLSTAVKVRSFVDGEKAAQADGDLDTIWIVVEGAFLLSRTWRNGRRFIYGQLMPGQIAGIVPVFDGQPCAYDFIARGKTIAFAVPGSVFREIAISNAAAALSIIAYLSRRARIDYAGLEMHALNSLRCRIAKAILWMTQGHDEGTMTHETGLPTRISQEELADIVGATRQSVNLELQRLMRDGILKRQDRGLAVLNIGRLREVAAEDEGIGPGERRSAQA